uniref:hypothetical protein n=1 Tax=Trichocoleus desertorum TaxID=1481672 RepID=UPI0025B5AF92|nr:hypothetical protein [Trichocoleus desertorum]
MLKSQTVLHHSPNNQPQIIDLGMSDEEYLELLAQGRDPVKEMKDQAYEQELLRYGISSEEARQVAPLLDQFHCSIEERILIARVLKQVWHQLIFQSCAA